jgi:hypothetical protein
MKCQTCQSHITEYLSGQLKADTLKDFKSHLSECETCRLQLKEMEIMWQTMDKLQEEDPGPAVRNRFYAMLEAEKREQEKRQHSRMKRFESWLESWWPNRPAIQFALTLALLAFGIWGGSRFTFQSHRSGEMVQLRNEIQEMRQTVSLSLLNQSSSSQRLKGVSMTSTIRQPSESLLTALLNTLNSDPNVNVRLAAVDALYLYSHRPEVRKALIQSLDNQTSPLVQISLMNLLVQIREKHALEALRGFIENQDVIPAVRQHAEKQLEELI